MKVLLFTIIAILFGIVCYMFIFSNPITCKSFLGWKPNYWPSSCSVLVNWTKICTKDMVYKGCSLDISEKFKKVFNSILD